VSGNPTASRSRRTKRRETARERPIVWRKRGTKLRADVQESDIMCCCRCCSPFLIPPSKTHSGCRGHPADPSPCEQRHHGAWRGTGTGKGERRRAARCHRSWPMLRSMRWTRNRNAEAIALSAMRVIATYTFSFGSAVRAKGSWCCCGGSMAGCVSQSTRPTVRSPSSFVVNSWATDSGWLRAARSGQRDPGSAIRAARSSFNIGSTASSSRWWHNGAILLNAVLTLKWLDTL